ncbi:MAG: hypothetical protein ACE5Z5_04665 [Candidatus Bathyarchaeia archaeon]
MNASFLNVELKALEATYRVRLGYVLFPLEFRELRDVLARNGYELAGLPGPIPPRPSRIGYGGEIARKDEYVVQIDSRECLVGISDKSIGTTFGAFRELTKVIKEGFGIDLNENVRYYDVVAHYNIDTGKKPVQEIDRVIEGNSYFPKFDKILGEPTSLFSVRLVPKGSIPNQEEWFDISIEPDILKPQIYHVGVVFRNPDREKSIRFINNLEKTLVNLIKVIEGGG